MKFLHPERLWLLAAAVGLVVAYVTVQVRRRTLARRFASAHLIPSVVPTRIGPWRHLVALVFLAGVVVSTLGAAQPTVAGEREREHATIVVAIDTSDSMKATDVAPTRLAAAKAAARDFVAGLPSTFDVALVTAGASPSVVVAPTTDHDAVLGAIADLTTAPGTALGEAIFTSLATIPTAPETASSSGRTATRAARIVLLSDGVTTTGRPDAEAIEAAAEARVPVSTIAFGTDDATVESQGTTVDVPVDPSALQTIAKGTGGTFFRAATAAQLASIYDTIDGEITRETTDVDVAEWFAGGALALVLAAVGVSVLATGRPVIA